MVCGGTKEGSSCRVYKSGQWISMSPMKFSRYGLAMTNLPQNFGDLMVSGGRGEGEVLLNSAEILKNGVWEVYTLMKWLLKTLHGKKYHKIPTDLSTVFTQVFQSVFQNSFYAFRILCGYTFPLSNFANQEQNLIASYDMFPKQSRAIRCFFDTYLLYNAN